MPCLSPRIGQLNPARTVHRMLQRSPCQKQNAFAGHAAPKKASELSETPTILSEVGLGVTVTPVSSLPRFSGSYLPPSPFDHPYDNWKGRHESPTKMT